MSVTLRSYFLGTVVRLVAQFTVAGVATDPTAVTFRIIAPDATITTYVYATDAEVVRDSAGVYHVDWTANQAGVWCFRYEGTGAAQAVAERQFTVDAGCFV